MAHSVSLNEDTELYKIISILAVVIIFSTLSCAEAAQKGKSKELSDDQVKKAIIKESIEQYPGNCPCPYNSASNGSSCGRRSAYSRAGGYAPLCYPSDVTKELIKEWRASH